MAGRFEDRARKALFLWIRSNGVILPTSEFNELVDEMTKLQLRAYREGRDKPFIPRQTSVSA